MLRALSALQPPTCTPLQLSLLSALYSSSCVASNAVSVASTSGRPQIPEATTNGDRLLNSAQLESMAIFRRFNISQPSLRGQVILAKVLRTTPRQVLVDPGYYGLNWISRQELASATAYAADGQPIQRDSPEILPGEYVKLRLSYFNTPYGDAQLDAVGVPYEIRQKLVWEELEHRMTTGKPVQGRILNTTSKGFSVAVGGYVAFLEHRQATPEQRQKIGVLQTFYVRSMNKGRRKIELSGYQAAAQGREVMRNLYAQSLPDY